MCLTIRIVWLLVLLLALKKYRVSVLLIYLTLVHK
jgi:hypothetical protein